jgi:hypothetical protein
MDVLEPSQRKVIIFHVSLQVFKAVTVHIVVFWVVLHDWGVFRASVGRGYRDSVVNHENPAG